MMIWDNRLILWSLRIVSINSSFFDYNSDSDSASASDTDTDTDTDSDTETNTDSAHPSSIVAGDTDTVCLK